MDEASPCHGGESGFKSRPVRQKQNTEARRSWSSATVSKTEGRNRQAGSTPVGVAIKNYAWKGYSIVRIYRPTYKKTEIRIIWKRLMDDKVVQARKGFKFKNDKMLICPACNEKIEQGPVYLVCFEKVGNRMCHKECVDNDEE